MEKVYCSECEYLKNFNPDFVCRKNATIEDTGNWLIRSERVTALENPKDINANNDCKDFKLKKQEATNAKHRNDS